MQMDKNSKLLKGKKKVKKKKQKQYSQVTLILWHMWSYAIDDISYILEGSGGLGCIKKLLSYMTKNTVK